MRPRPAGADNFLKWRRIIDEHLELRRMTWDEYAMFNWLCTKANPRSGALGTSWPTLGEQTGLTPNHVEKLCDARAGQPPPRSEETTPPVAIRQILADQPWWRPSADGPPYPTALEAGPGAPGEASTP